MALEAPAGGRPTPVRRVVLTSLVAMTIEWRDFFLYGPAVMSWIDIK